MRVQAHLNIMTRLQACNVRPEDCQAYTDHYDVTMNILSLFTLLITDEAKSMLNKLINFQA
jgi:hypothetical protein